MQTSTHPPKGADRRGNDRRKEQVAPLAFADRREGDRRSLADRRTAPRG